MVLEDALLSPVSAVPAIVLTVPLHLSICSVILPPSQSWSQAPSSWLLISIMNSLSIGPVGGHEAVSDYVA